MQVGYTFAVVFALLICSIFSYKLPVEFDEEYNPVVSKRHFYNNNKQYKREFNADDLTLRFGKRSDAMAFSPDQLSLRFGRRR
ncbi:unnamed protein product [Caenorhabditis angaria]|uniref:Uncharacterized protein n=1 Tax=Caenorhabditis angaria TaxID=860376 RepID=A0A9P1IZQ5_9PELO|nr:unnamed protein product [Caenorhabditis angaria]